MARQHHNADHPELGLPEVRKLWQTEGLFSDHYLKARLRQNAWWPGDTAAEPTWRFCKELYEKRYIAGILYNSQNVPLYLFCFASANPKGAPTALKIANDLLKRLN